MQAIMEAPSDLSIKCRIQLIGFWRSLQRKNDVLGVCDDIADSLSKENLEPVMQEILSYLLHVCQQITLGWMALDQRIAAHALTMPQVLRALFPDETQYPIRMRLEWMFRQLGYFISTKDLIYQPVTPNLLTEVGKYTIKQFRRRLPTLLLKNDPFGCIKLLKKIKIGILSPDLGFDHHVTYLLYPLLANLASKEYEIIVLSTADGSSHVDPQADLRWSQKFFRKSVRLHLEDYMKKLSEQNLEVTHDILLSIAKEIAGCKCDILLDITGIWRMKTHAQLIMRHRFSMCRLVVRYPLEFPATSCCKNMDALIADEVLLPTEQHRYVSERVANFPVSMLPGGFRDLFPHLTNKMELDYEGNVMILNSINPIPKWIRNFTRVIWDGLCLGGENSTRRLFSVAGIQFVNGDSSSMTRFFGKGVTCGATQLPPSCVIVTSRVLYNIPARKKVLGLFGDLCKLSDDIWSVYVSVMQAVPNSILLVSLKNDTNEPLRIQNIKNYLQAKEINVDRRVCVVDEEPIEVRLRLMQLVTVHLDSFPFSGAETLLQVCVSRGIILTTSFGTNIHSRIGTSLAQAMHMEELVASSKVDMVEKCINILKCGNWCQELRRRIRNRVQVAPMFSPQLSAYYFGDLLKELLQADALTRAHAFAEENPDKIFKYRTLGNGPTIESTSEPQKLHKIIADLMARDNAGNSDTVNWMVSDHESDSEDEEIEYEWRGGNADLPVQYCPRLKFATASVVQGLRDELPEHASIAQRILAIEILASAVYGILHRMRLTLFGSTALPYPSGPIMASCFVQTLKDKMQLTDIPIVAKNEIELSNFLPKLKLKFEHPAQYMKLLHYFRCEYDGSVKLCEKEDSFSAALVNIHNCIHWDSRLSECTLSSNVSPEDTANIDKFFEEKFNGCPFCSRSIDDEVNEVKDYESFRMHYNNFHKAGGQLNQCDTCGMEFGTQLDLENHNHTAHTQLLDGIGMVVDCEVVGRQRKYDKCNAQLDDPDFEVDVFATLNDQIDVYRRKEWEFSSGQKQLTFCWIERAANYILDTMRWNPAENFGTHIITVQYLYSLQAHWLTLRMPLLSTLPTATETATLEEIQGRLGDFTFYDHVQLKCFLNMFHNGQIHDSECWKMTKISGNHCPCAGINHPHAVTDHLDPNQTEDCDKCGFIIPQDSRRIFVKKLHAHVHLMLKLKYNWPQN